MKVDCHTHWGTGWGERDGEDPASFLRMLDRHGLTHALLLPWAGLLDAGKAAADHDRLAAVAARAGGRLVPFCTANLWYPDTALPELQRCLGSLGFRGIKFHPWLQGYNIATPAMDEVCELAAEHGVPILIHDGTPPFCLPSQVALLAQRHPRTRLVLGHCGLLEHWTEAIEAMRAADNLWGSLCSPHAAAMREILRACDRGRLVWGSDVGYNLDDSYDYKLGVMEHLGLDDATRRAIFADNPARLLGLKGGSERG